MGLETALAVSSAASLAGAGMSAAGSYYNAKNTKLAMNAQAAQDDVNAQIDELAAQSAITQGQRAEQNQRLKTAQLKSTQRTGFAANGIDLGSDTAVNVLTSTDTMGEIDANTIKSNAVMNAWGYRTQAVSKTNDALLKRASASSISPWLSAGTSLLTSASSVGRDYYLLDKAGAFNRGA